MNTDQENIHLHGCCPICINLRSSVPKYYNALGKFSVHTPQHYERQTEEQ